MAKGHKRVEQSKNGLTKVLFELPATDWYTARDERLWAKPLGKDLHQLMNSPFYAYGCSYLDVVSARKNASDDLVFDRVVTKSGHATYRIIVKDALRFAAAWQPLELEGCTYEGLESRVYSVDLPPGTDLDAVRDSLKAAKDTGIWDYEAADLPPMKPSLGDTMNPTQGKQ